jgi:nicotinamide-nucleotide amidase
VDVSLSLTGVAGPSGGTPEKPVGLVHFAVATARGSTARQIQFPGSREQVRKLAAYAGLALVRRVLLHGHQEP